MIKLSNRGGSEADQGTVSWNGRERCIKLDFEGIRRQKNRPLNVVLEETIFSGSAGRAGEQNNLMNAWYKSKKEYVRVKRDKIAEYWYWKRKEYCMGTYRRRR